MSSRCLPLLSLGLLLATTACQRASYSFQPAPAAPATTVVPIHPPAPPVVPPSGPPTALASQPARLPLRPALRHVRQLRLAQGPPRGAGPEVAADRPSGPGLAVPRRHVAAARLGLHRRPSTNLGVSNLFFVLTLLAPVVGGLLLIFGVGTGWAIAGGILLALLGPPLVLLIGVILTPGLGNSK